MQSVFFTFLTGSGGDCGDSSLLTLLDSYSTSSSPLLLLLLSTSVDVGCFFCILVDFDW
jgi:hypothetical protein